MEDQKPPASLWQEIKDDWAFYRTLPGGPGSLREPGFWICAVHRLGARAKYKRTPLGTLMRLCYVGCRFFILAITGVDIRSGARIGRRFEVHTAQGIMVVDDAVIGDDCTINTGVCIAHKANGKNQGVPTLGNGVWMGMGSKIIGPVRIGDRVAIGANAVVMQDIPADCLAVGIPAVAKPRSSQRAKEMSES